MKRVKAMGDRIMSNELGSTSQQERNAAVDHIKSLLIRVLPNLIKGVRQAPDVLEDYKTEFGNFFGPHLHAAVIRSRSTLTPLPSVAGQVVSTPTFGQKTTLIHPSNQGIVGQQKFVIVQQPGQPVVAPGGSFIRMATNPAPKMVYLGSNNEHHNK